MMKKYFAIFSLVLFVASTFFATNSSFAQVQKSLGPVPVSERILHSNQQISTDNVLNNNNRGFVYVSTSTHQFGSQFMTSTTITNIGSPQTYGFPGAMVAYPTGIYVNDQLSPFGIYSIDTVTGNKTLIVNVTGITLTNFTGMTWDGTQMWGIQSNITSSQIGTINLSSGVFTPVGPTTTACAGGISISAAPNGSLFTVDIVGNNLVRWNKTTGVPTTIGPLGVDANWGQDASFDPSDGKFYWASAWVNGANPAEDLRTLDTTTGAGTLYGGTYAAQISAIAVIPPGTTFAHDYSVPNFISLPSQWVKNIPVDVKAIVRNVGSTAETNVPVKFFVNGTLTGTPINKSLAPNAFDSVTFSWTPPAAGTYTLKIASALSTDMNRLNDTASISVNVTNTPLMTIFCDDFATTSNWTLTMAGGTVPWSSIASYSRYTMPSTATPPGLGCDVDLAGSGSSSNATATLTTAVNCSAKTGIYLEFDHDWYPIGTTDHALIDLSIDGGTTWTNLVDWNTVHRNAHEIIQLPTAENQSAVKIRFTAVQPSWDWWWVIDNVCIKGYGATGVGNINSNVPNKYSLSQNYPNPFNPVTRISFELPKQGFVNLKVYDVLGKEVKTLVNEVRGAGSYTVDFNAAELSSGVYFYRLESNGFTDIKKMMLIK